LFSKYSVHIFVTDERTDRRTDGRTDGETGREHNASGHCSLDWRTDNYSSLLLLRSRVDHAEAELVLSAIAKFLVHLLGEGEGRAEMGDGRGRGTE